MDIFAVGRNYLQGNIPTSLNRLTALKFLFLFSNEFQCRAPDLNSAPNLAEGVFSGYTYPAMIDAVDYLAQNALLNKAAVVQHLDANKPAVPNTADIFAGNQHLLDSVCSCSINSVCTVQPRECNAHH
jgi:hypothetical protein